jgi:hypothetical protein
MTDDLRDSPALDRPASVAPDAVASADASPSRRMVFIEIGLFLALALVVDSVWGGGNRFMTVEPHPFWVIVLLMAVQYGTTEALLATAASTTALLAWNLPGQAFDQNVHQYALQVFFRPLLWMVASVVIGELRARHRLQQEHTSMRLRDAERQVALLSTSHADLTAAKARLETRLAGQLRTAAGVLEAARPLETLDPGRVLAGAGDLVRTALHAKAFSLYLLQGDALVLAAAEGSSAARTFAPRFTSSTALFQEIVGAQRFVSAATPAGERLLEGEGLMAGPLIDPSTGTLFGMLKIEELRFLDFNLGSLQTFKAVAAWIAAAYGSAVAHKRSQIEDDATRLYGAGYLDRQTGYLTGVARRFGFDLTLLTFRIQSDDLNEQARQALPAILGDVSRQVLRGTDLVFGEPSHGTEFSVLLPGATAESALLVAEKLAAALREACGHDVPYTTQVRALCVAGEASMRRRRRKPSTGRVA